MDSVGLRAVEEIDVDVERIEAGHVVARFLHLEDLFHNHVAAVNGWFGGILKVAVDDGDIFVRAIYGRIPGELDAAGAIRHSVRCTARG